MLDKGLVPDDDTYDTLVNGKFQGTNGLVETSCRDMCQIWLFCLWHAFLHSCIPYPRTGWGTQLQVGDDGFSWWSSQRCCSAGMDLLKQLRRVLSWKEPCRFPFICWYLWSETNNVLHDQTPRDLALLLHPVMAIGVFSWTPFSISPYIHIQFVVETPRVSGLLKLIQMQCLFRLRVVGALVSPWQIELLDTFPKEPTDSVTVLPTKFQPSETPRSIRLSKVISWKSWNGWLCLVRASLIKRIILFFWLEKNLCGVSTVFEIHLPMNCCF